MAEDSKSSAPWWMAAVIPIIGAIATYLATSGAQARKNAATEKSAKEALAEQHRNAYVSRLRDHEQAEKNLMQSLAGQYYQVYADNQCSRAVSVAMRYTALDGVVSVKGWVNVPPNDNAYLFPTWAKTFNYYAKDEERQSPVWSGSEQQTITNDLFYYMDDEDFRDGWYPLPNARSVGLIQASIHTNDFGKFTVPITCSGK